MWPKLPFQPDQASTIAKSVDNLYFFLTALTLFFSAIIFLTIFYFSLKYRRRSEDERPAAIEGSLGLEIAWSLIPALLTVVIFVWSSSLYFKNSRPPLASTEIFVIGKQWMWQMQHPEGLREINELHVPVGVPVKLTMTSEDVIHDFYIPAFRVKKDVMPGRYTSIWFEATEPGAYHLFCAQFCGAGHAAMIGWVYVMTPTDYTRWLTGGGTTGGPGGGAAAGPGGGAGGGTMVEAGARLFEKFACVTCHVADGTGRGPSFQGLFGKPVRLVSGQTVAADESFIRECILTPLKQPVAGYPPLMPTFQGQLSEEQILQLIAYIKSLGSGAAPAPPSGAAKPSAPEVAKPAPGAPGETPEAAGAKLFAQFSCQTCHVAAGGGIGPSLQGVYGKPVRLASGQTVTADESYLRECILTPKKRPLAGYPPMMPAFEGRLSEEQVSQLLAYIKSLGSAAASAPRNEGAKPAAPGEAKQAPGAPGETTEAAGAKLFTQLACSTCHPAEGAGLGPSLQGVYGKPVHLANGQTVTADESYIRDCILTPSKRPLAGFPPIMPAFQGQLSEDQISQLVAYIKSLSSAEGKTTP